MVVVEFDYNEFKDLFGVPKENVIISLTEIGAPTEIDHETGKLLIEVTPNRPDWYSIEGLARALRSYHKKENKEYKVKKSDYRVYVDKSVSKVRPYTACAIVKNLKFDDRLIRDVVLLQEKLITTLGRRVRRFGLGVYPLKEIEFPVRYIAMKPEEIVYTPLNYPKEANAREILREHPKGKENSHLLAGYDKYPVFLDHKNRIMALIPIVNSAETGKVDENTKEIFVEVTGNDKTGINQALNILVCAFADMGGEVYEVIVDYEGQKNHTPDLEYKKMKLDLEKMNKILGVKIKEKDVQEMLKRMGYGYKAKEKTVLIPPYRADVMDEIDIIEDIAIVYGYNKFEPTIPNFFYPGKKSSQYKDVGSSMQRMGFVEINTPVLTSRERLEQFGCKGIDVLNPKTNEYTTIRSNLVPNMVEVIARNKMKGLPQKFYEIGSIVDPTSKQEKKAFCFGVTDKKLEFSSVRGYLQGIAQLLGGKIELKAVKHVSYEEPYSLDILKDGKKIGAFGKLNKRIMDSFGLEFPVFVVYLELNA